MKIWLDDERPAPEGWVWIKDPTRMMEIFCFEETLEEISLDHDMGEHYQGRELCNGGAVLNMMERLVYEDGWTPPIIHIHTKNPVARKWMMEVANKLNALRQSNA